MAASAGVALLALVAAAALATTDASPAFPSSLGWTACEDDPNFWDALYGYSCADWGTEDNDNNGVSDCHRDDHDKLLLMLQISYDYYFDEERTDEIRDNCPKACGMCEPEPYVPCKDDIEFQDANGYNCAAWGVDYDSNGVIDCHPDDHDNMLNYVDEDGIDEIRAACPRTCGMCGTEEPKENPKFEGKSKCKGKGKKKVCDLDHAVVSFFDDPDQAVSCKVAKANGMCKAKGGHGALIKYFCPVTCKNRKLKSKDHKKDQNKIAEAVFGTTCKDLDKPTVCIRPVNSGICPKRCKAHAKCSTPESYGNKKACCAKKKKNGKPVCRYDKKTYTCAAK